MKSFSNGVDCLASIPCRKANQSSRPQSFRPAPEALESRDLLSSSPVGYALSSGYLYETVNHREFLIDTGVASIQTDGRGDVAVLQSSGALEYFNPSLGWRYIDGNVSEFTMLSSGKVYDLDAQGYIYSYSPSAGRQVLDALAQSYQALPGGTLFAQDWFTQNLPDASIQSLARQDFLRDSGITFSDMLGIFTDVEQHGALTAAEMTSLQDLVAGGSTLNMPGYVQFLADKVVNGDPANAPFGDLFVGSSATQVGQVAGEWFLGTDLPSLVSGEGYYVNYYDPSGNVFGNGISYQQVSQGQVGDCTLMASMAEVAARLPGDIQSMFIFDGYFHGTSIWTVRLFDSGASFYVTVNSELPTRGASPAGGALWAPLLEKAIAQANASGWLQTFAPQAGDSYAAINDGNPNTTAAYLSALTGLQSSGWTVTYSYTVGPSYVAQALQEGKLVVVLSDSSDSILNNQVVPGHAYAVIGYNGSSSTPFELYNPWGVGSYTNYQPPGTDTVYSVFGNAFFCNAEFLQQNYWTWIETGSTPG
jgi:Calpain family cysteine protease